MANTDYRSIDHYIASQPEIARPVLERVRAAIRTAVPAAEEAISYQIPAFRLDGRMLIYFAGWKQHYSLYPVTPKLIAHFGDALADCDVNHKGTIRFRLDQKVPAGLIGRIAKYQANQVRTALKAKTAKKKAAARASGAGRKAST